MLKYFTAIVSGLDDPERPVRQQTYIRALEAYIPEIQVVYGKFLRHPVSMPLANVGYPERSKEMFQRTTGGELIFQRVIKTEEKGSDVNIAVHLLNDAWLDIYDCAVLVSNDSDLAEALWIVREHHPMKTLGLILPADCKPSRELMRSVHFIKQIRSGVLRDSQLPSVIPGTNIHKPVSW